MGDFSNNDGESFDNAEEAWFWFCRCLKIKNEGPRAHSDSQNKLKILEVCDIHRIVARLPISERILRVMMRFGFLGQPPDHNARARKGDEALWSMGIAAFEVELRRKDAIR